MSYGVRPGPQGIGWEVYEMDPEGTLYGVTFRQAVARARLVAGWQLSVDHLKRPQEIEPWWSLPVAWTVGAGGRINP